MKYFSLPQLSCAKCCTFPHNQRTLHENCTLGMKILTRFHLLDDLNRTDPHLDFW